MSDPSGATDSTASPTPSALRSLCYADGLFASRYEGWDEIGNSGNNTAVVKVTSRFERGPIALKILLNMHEDLLPLFAREALTSRSVVSSYVVRTLSGFTSGAISWLEMEWVDGTDLDRELKRRQGGEESAEEPYPIAEALDVAMAVCHGLAAAHAVGILHRDIKPANILLPRCGEPRAKLTDFGIAKFADSPRLTKTDLFRGTPLYSSPEAFEGKPLTSAHDIYCLGLCLFLLFSTRRYPFEVDDAHVSARSLAMVHVRKPPRRLRDVRRDAPEAIEDLIAQCLNKRPEQRPTAVALAAELDRIKGTLTAPETAVRSVSRRRKAVYVALGLLAAGLLGLIALIVVVLWIGGPTSPEITSTQAPTAGAASPPPASLSPLALPEHVATIRIENGFLVVTAGGAEVKGEIEVLAGPGERHRQKITLAPGDLAWVSLAELTPPLPATAKVREVRLTVTRDGTSTTYTTTP